MKPPQRSGSGGGYDDPHADADTLALDELLALIGDADALAQPSVSSISSQRDSGAELCPEDLDFLFSSSPSSGGATEDFLAFNKSPCEHIYSSRDASGSSRSSSEEIVAALVLSSEERDALLSALESESADDDNSASRSLVDDWETRGGSGAAPDSVRAGELSDSAPSESDGSSGAHFRSPSEESQPTSQREQELQQNAAKKPRRRKRQKDEMNYLEYRVRHLEAELEQLRWQERAFTEETLVVASRFNLVPKYDLLAASRPDQWLSTMLSGTTSRSELWERIARLEKEETRTAVLENMRLRAQYESQLQVVKRLESLYHNHISFAVADASPERGFLSKRSRTDAFSDDVTIFGSLGRNFDAQYAQTDMVLKSSGLLFVDGEMQGQMQLKRDERGVFCLENISCKVAPFDVHTIDRVFWHCRSNEELQQHHGVYQIRDITNDTIFTKSVDPLQLPNGAEPTTVTMWTALRRYVEEHRCVAVCEAVVEVVGSISMRLREKTWNVLRPATSRSPPLVQHGGPVTLVQSCVRMTPEIGGSVSAHDLAVGTLTNLVAGSYHRHNQLMHQVAENLLSSEFTNLTL